MSAYFIVYLISFFFMWISSKFENINKVLMYISALFSIGFLALFSAMANLDVGIDRLTYGNNMFFYANKSNLFSELLYYFPGDEKGYLLFNWLVSRFTDNVHIFYFIHSFIISAIFYATIRLYKGLCSINFMWFVYLGTFFGLTLCLLRQSISVALVSYAISLLLTKDLKILPLLLLGLSITFHYSGVIGFIIYGLVIFLKKKDMSFSNQIIVLILISFIFSNFVWILPRLVSIGFLSEKYIDYANGFLANADTSMGVVTIILALLGLLFLKEIQKDKILKIIYFLVLINIFIYSLESISSVLGRMGMYFKIFLMVYYSYLSSDIRYKKKVITMSIIILYILFANNGFIFGLKNQGGVGTFRIYPYQSELLDRLF